MKPNKELYPINVKDMTKNGECSNCGNCCNTFLPLSQDEIKTIQGYLKNHPEIPNERHIDYKNGNMFMTCAFRDNKKRVCNIYEVRPWICRKFICNQSKGIIKHNRSKAFATAIFNTHSKPTASTQYIFFGDEDWELQYLRNMTSDLNKAIFLAKVSQSPILERLQEIKRMALAQDKKGLK